MSKFILLLAFALSLNALNLDEVNTTCPITSSDVKKNKELLSAIEYKNGKVLLFSSPKAMFDYIYHIDDFSMPIKETYVTNFASKELIPANKAFYLFGSRYLSISGDDLIAFDSNKTATKFIKIIGGSKILEYNDISKILIDYLNGR